MRITGKLQRGEAGRLADVLGGDLIDRDAREDITPGGLFHSDTGEEGAIGTGMIAWSICTAIGIVVIESRDDLDAVLQ
jgi:hypothetical protein